MRRDGSRCPSGLSLTVDEQPDEKPEGRASDPLDLEEGQDMTIERAAAKKHEEYHG